MADDIGSVKSISGTSMALNNQPGTGANKPMASGKDNPGGTKPSAPSPAPVPMPK